MRARIAADAWGGGARPSRATRTERALQPQDDRVATLLDGHVHGMAELDVGHGARLRRGAVEERSSKALSDIQCDGAACFDETKEA